MAGHPAAPTPQPGGRRHQGHRRLLPHRQQQVRRHRRRRRGHPVLPLPRHRPASARRTSSARRCSTNTPAGASLDAGPGAQPGRLRLRPSVTIGGATMPVPDLAVGRLVKTPAEIEATIAHFLSLGGRQPARPGRGARWSPATTSWPTPPSAVNEEFATALPGGAQRRADRRARGHRPTQSWNADHLARSCSAATTTSSTWPGTSAPTTPWPPTSPRRSSADELDRRRPNAGALTDTLVLSAGCHSGYNIVDDEAGVGPTPSTGRQRLAQQQAAAHRRHRLPVRRHRLPRVQRAALPRHRQAPARGPTTGRRAGRRDRDARSRSPSRTTWRALSTLQGIDQKAVLQATLYGLPMTGFDAPGREPSRPSTRPRPQRRPPAAGAPGGPRARRPESTMPLDDADRRRHSKPSPRRRPPDGQLTWRKGATESRSSRACRRCPSRSWTSPSTDHVLRGVGFRGGDYTDTTGPAAAHRCAGDRGLDAQHHVRVPTFFPQKLATANYFGALGASGRTSLILTPAQYRNDPDIDPQLPTNAERAFSDLGMRLFYSGDEHRAFGGQPAGPRVRAGHHRRQGHAGHRRHGDVLARG